MVSHIDWLEQSLPSDLSTQSLVEIARDQPAAFDAIYSRYRQPLYAYVKARVGNEDDALDIVQEVFLRAFRGLPRYEHREDVGDSPFTAWLFRIARNAVTDHQSTFPKGGDAGGRSTPSGAGGWTDRAKETASFIRGEWTALGKTAGSCPDFPRGCRHGLRCRVGAGSGETDERGLDQSELPAERFPPDLGR